MRFLSKYSEEWWLVDYGYIDVGDKFLDVGDQFEMFVADSYHR